MVAAHYDATERQQMLEDLEQQRNEAKANAAQLQAAQEEQDKAHKRLINSINSMRNGFVLWDSDARLVIANEAFRSYHKELAHLIHKGMSARDLLEAGHEINFWKWNEELPSNWLDIFMERFKSTKNFEDSFETTDGRYLVMQSSKLPNGDIISNFTDVTNNRLREAELVRARDALTPHRLFRCPHGASKPRPRAAGSRSAVHEQAEGYAFCSHPD